MRDWVRLLRHIAALTLRTDRRAAIVLAALTAGQAGVIAGIGLSQRWLVDGATASDRAVTAGAVILGALAYAASSTAGRVAGNLTLYLTGRVRIAFSAEIVHTVAATPTVAHLEHGPHVNRWNRVLSGGEAIVAMPWTALNAGTALLSLAVTIGLLAWVSPLLVPLALLAVPLFLAQRRADRLLREARDTGAELLRRERRLHDLCVEPEPAKEVMLSGGGPALSARAAELWDEAVALEARARAHGAVTQAAAWLLYAAGFGAALGVASLAVAGSPGAVVMVVSLAAQLQEQLRTMLRNLTTVAQAGEVVGHYWWLRRYHAAASRGGEPAPERLAGGIVLTGVRFRYPGADQDTLHGLDLRLPAGSTVAVVGANGAGKSTLIKLLTGLYEPTSGRIEADGRDLSTIDPAAWRSRMSGMYQDFARLRLSARETVGVGDVRHIRDRDSIVAAVGRAGADPVLAALPDGLDTRLGAAFGGIEPSLGQWQRLALARSLMRPAPPLLMVLDEPTAALDPLAEHELFQHFVGQVREATARGAVTVLVSHRFTTVRMADLIVVVDDGRVTESGTHTALMAAGGAYAQLYHLQERAYRS
ncbi:ABC transporter ATP-binding protein [Actinoplanes sp. NBRC 103695]|uniref:ABC transporter ATP-binding protein n=1 Tax=Actinoplanes sp. NBRC 103695 TaxID=3032202 RepID=UPI0024A0A4F0|nr:ABC transporter ATP-binding protein [Actinoplanes sp. NBRC 103695]GLY96139.1 ABC transporter permease [Actinoplanes sp. NBRC 103695]